MAMHRRTVLASALASAALAVGSGPAAALTLGFQCISDNDASNCATGEAQLQAESSAGPSAGLVSFAFTNSGPNASSIIGVYFEDQGSDLLDGMDSFLEGSGVDFEFDADPFDLPDGDEVDPDFEASFSVGAESLSGGIDPGEILTVLAELSAGRTFDDVEAALLGGSLRLGLHVQGFESENDNNEHGFESGGSKKRSKNSSKLKNGGGHKHFGDKHFDHEDCDDKDFKKGESFVNNGTVVPEPSIGLLLGAPLLALVRRGRRQR
jgi:hypothetical protein